MGPIKLCVEKKIVESMRILINQKVCVQTCVANISLQLFIWLVLSKPLTYLVGQTQAIGELSFCLRTQYQWRILSFFFLGCQNLWNIYLAISNYY